ncbi:hypothetical protein [Deinococcus aluminii]|uniref:FUSC family protein n=1 Tax=Deinococcus aluminii TaxID=1656885 RepID=A0ABP9XH22_9DEIO
MTIHAPVLPALRRVRLPVAWPDAALVVALALGALLSPPLLVVALALATCFALHAALPGTLLRVIVTRVLAYAVISLTAGLLVTAAVGCSVGLITTMTVYFIASLRS